MTTVLHTLLLGAEHKRAPVEFADRVVPGMTRARLYQEFAQRGYRRGAEIGVADGRNAQAICEAIPGVELLCVDPWQKYAGNPRGGPQEQHDHNFALAQERLRPYRVEFVRMMAFDASLLVALGSLDFVYVDGNHQPGFVDNDLLLWAARVRSGGIVSGHDFYHFGSADVVAAVVAYTRAHGIADWHLCDEREPSFWWVKP